MATTSVPVDSLPEIVRDSELKVQFVREGNRSFVIHTHTSRRRSAEEKWLVKQHLLAGGQGSVDLQTRVAEEFGQPSLRAVKRVMVPNLQKAARSKMYQRELETIAKFSLAKFSKLFVTSYGWYLGPGCINIAMEYCELGDLNKYLQNSSLCPQNRLPESDTREIADQVLEALSTMHQEKFCHRDLKLANILIKRTGPRWWVKVADFGLSKRGGDSTTNFSAGSRGYMSPEISGFKDLQSKVDPYAVDMWSLGQVVAKLLTGQVLFPTQIDLGRYYFHDISFPEEKLKKFQASDKLVDFVRGLTRVKPAERLTALKALDHPWMDMAVSPGPHGASWEESSWSSENFRDPDDPSNVWPDDFTSKRKYERNAQDTTAPSNPWPDQDSKDQNDGESATEKAAEAHKDAGNELFKQEKYDLAIEEYTKAIKLMPSSALYLGNRAAAYMSHFRWMEALTDCLDAVELEPPAPKLRLRLGRIYTRLGMPEKALPIYQQIHGHVREKDVNRARLMANNIELARQAMQVDEDYSSTLSLIDKAKADLGTLAPTPREWKLMQIEAYINLRQRGIGYELLTEASQIVDDLLLKNYHDTEALHFRHRIAITLVMPIRPTSTEDSSTASTGTGETAEKSGDTDDTTQSIPVDENPPASETNAETHVKSEVKIYDDDEIIRMKNIGNEAYNKGQFAKAIEIYSDALSIWPGEHTANAPVVLNRAQAYIKLGYFQLGIKDCEHAIRLDPSYEKPHVIKKHAERKLAEAMEEEPAVKTGDKSPGETTPKEKEAPQAQSEETLTICPGCGQSFESKWKFINHARQFDHFLD